MAVDNRTIINQVFLRATSDYQQRIPQATQGTIAQTVRKLFDIQNRPYLNQFMDILVNRIGFTYVHQQSWDNPLSVFKRPKLNYGSTIQEIIPAWVKAHQYRDDVETLLKMYRPEAGVNYHTQNRRDKYPITVNAEELRSAFVDEYGLNQLVAGIMQAPINSDEYDEYRIMWNLISEYEAGTGFYKHHMDSAPNDEETAKAFLKQLRAYRRYFSYPTANYNAPGVDIPVFEKDLSRMVLFIDPQTEASIDVDALAVLFHMEKAEVQSRVIVLDTMPVPNAFALLTTDDFFVCADTLYENASFYNPETLSTNYFLHHWGVYSVSGFVPSVLFTTGKGTETPVVTMTTSGFTAEAASATVAPGGTLEITTDLVGTIEPSGYDIEVLPDSAVWSVAGTLGGAPVKLRANTYVDEFNTLHVAKTEKVGTELLLTATSTYVNPSGETTEYTAKVNVTIALDESSEKSGD